MRANFDPANVPCDVIARRIIAATGAPVTTEQHNKAYAEMVAQMLYEQPVTTEAMSEAMVKADAFFQRLPMDDQQIEAAVFQLMSDPDARVAQRLKRGVPHLNHWDQNEGHLYCRMFAELLVKSWGVADNDYWSNDDDQARVRHGLNRPLNDETRDAILRRCDKHFQRPEMPASEIARSVGSDLSLRLDREERAAYDRAYKTKSGYPDDYQGDDQIRSFLWP